jgi:tRNA pseudouridine55 synthase
MSSDWVPNGWIILDKPLGLGSTQAVAAVKRNLREAGFGKIKVGHGGTLDPLATGVLPIALGEATKLCGRMLDASKVYDFTIAFGTQTSGLDAEGEVVATSDVRPSLVAIEGVLPRFTGTIEQIPPAYSAIKIDGKRAYDLARAGEVVEMKARGVTVHSLSMQNLRHSRAGGNPSPDLDNTDSGCLVPIVQVLDSRLRGNDEVCEASLDCITLSAHVSKGTYIRSLARDIAIAVGTVGHVTMLRRSKAEPFSLSQAISLDKLNEIGKGAPLEDVILPMEAGLDDIPALTLSPEQARAIREGRVLTGIATEDGLFWARDAEMRAVALIELIDGTTKIVRGFNL